MTSYSKSLQNLYQVACFLKMRLGLDNIKKLLLVMGQPHFAYPCIHVAGTNGKGSVATKIAKALSLSGYHAGLFTSPHLCSFRERIKIGETFISEEEVTEEIEKLFSLARLHDIKPTFFEIITALAFEHFRKRKVDVAIIETGLGGRLDSTNVLMPILSVITTISLDHTSILGNTLEEIAFEKAGIIKNRVPVILGPKAIYKSILTKAFASVAPCLFVPEIAETFDKENQEIAISALCFLKSSFPKLTEIAIAKGIEKNPPCRFEKIQGVILDTAHNPQGFEALFQKIKQDFPDKKIHMILGFSKDKDLENCLSLAMQNASYIYAGQANNPRSASREEILHILREKRFSRSDKIKLNQESLEKACLKAKKDKALLVIAGSFYLLGEMRKYLGIEEPIDPIAINDPI